MKIAHLADIHIRIASRQEEYKSVFEKTYKSISKKDVDLIYIAGDLFHSKLHLSPESVSMATNFLESLSDIAPVLLILGNHDTSLKSKSYRMDALEPLKRLNKHSKHGIKIWQDSTVETIDDVNFIHYSCLDEKIPEIPDNGINICVHHGMVQGSSNANGYIYDKSDRNIPFQKFDATLLGDIHKVQTLPHNTYYAGSLICQNFGEDPFKHGYLIHDTNDLSSPVFVKISNDYTHLKMEVEGGKLPEVKNVKPTYKVKVVYSDTDSLEEIKSEYYDKYGDFSKVKFIQESTIDKKKKEIDVDDDTKIDLTDPRQQEKYMRMYFEDEEKTEEIIELNDRLFKDLGVVSEVEVLNWRLKKMEFNNTFSYGEGNVVDFENNKGIIGVFGRNATGKSSLLDTIPTLGWGKFPKMEKGSDYVNNKEDKAAGSLILDLNGEEGVITRKTSVNKKGHSKNDLEFHIEDRNLTENVTNTTKNIEKYIGSYDEYVRTAYVSQQSPDLFLNMKNSERKEWLSANLNIDFFQRLHEDAKKESKELKNEVTFLGKTDYTHEIGLKFKEKNEATGNVEKVAKSIDELKKLQIDTEEKIDELKSNLKEVPTVDYSKEELEKTISKKEKLEEDLEGMEESMQLIKKGKNSESKEFDNKIEKIITRREDLKNNFVFEELVQKQNKYQEVVSEGKQLKKNIVSAKEQKEELGDVEGDYEKIENEIKKYNDLKKEVSRIEDRIVDLEKNTKVLSKDERFENEKLCQTCPLLDNAFKSKEQLKIFQEELKSKKSELSDIDIDGLKTGLELMEEKKQSLENVQDTLKKYSYDIEHKREQRDDLKKEISQLKSVKNDRLNEKLESLNDRIENLKAEKKVAADNAILNCKNTIKTIKEELDDVYLAEQMLQQYEEIKKIIKHNEKIEEKIKSHKSSITNIKDRLDDLFEDKNEAEAELKFIEKEIKDLEKKKKKLEKLKDEYYVYEKYIEATHKNNLPTLIIENVLELIEDEVNTVLNNMSDYAVKFILDGDNLNVNVYHPEKGRLNSSRLSGMESFIVNLSIRIALTKLSNTPTSNFLIVDEGFSSLDAEMVSNIPHLFDYLRSEYDFIMVVSHNQYMVDFVDHNFEINNVDGFSYINE